MKKINNAKTRRYRCSCCDKIKQKSDATMLVWSRHKPDLGIVQICIACNSKIKIGKFLDVLTYLERAGLNE